MMRFAVTVVLALGCVLAPPGARAARADASAADPLAERLLGAIGGREAWARVRNLVNDSQQNRVDEPTVVRTVITMDFERPRFRIETTAAGLHLIRVVDGDAHWRLSRAGNIEPVPQATLETDRRWHAGHVYRTLHRIAARDPKLRLGVDGAGRLEVFEGDDRIAWFAVDARGEPFAFGGFRDSTGSLCGPWDFEQAGIRDPVWISSPDGTFRVRIVSLRVNARLDDASFVKPVAAPRREGRRP